MLKKLMMRVMFGKNWGMIRRRPDGGIVHYERSEYGGWNAPTQEAIHHFTGRKAA